MHSQGCICSNLNFENKINFPNIHRKIFQYSDNVPSYTESISVTDTNQHQEKWFAKTLLEIFNLSWPMSRQLFIIFRFVTRYFCCVVLELTEQTSSNLQASTPQSPSFITVLIATWKSFSHFISLTLKQKSSFVLTICGWYMHWLLYIKPWYPW